MCPLRIIVWLSVVLPDEDLRALDGFPEGVAHIEGDLEVVFLHDDAGLESWQWPGVELEPTDTEATLHGGHQWHQVEFLWVVIVKFLNVPRRNFLDLVFINNVSYFGVQFPLGSLTWTSRDKPVSLLWIARIRLCPLEMHVDYACVCKQAALRQRLDTFPKNMHVVSCVVPPRLCWRSTGPNVLKWPRLMPTSVTIARLLILKLSAIMPVP